MDSFCIWGDFMEEKYYAYLMQRVNLDVDLYVFKPISLIEGTLEVYMEDRQCFVTDDNEFYFANDIVSLDLDGDLVVYNLISESDLLKEYQTDNISEAKAMYSETLLEYVYFGVASYTDENEEIIIGQAPVNELLHNIVNARDMGEVEDENSEITQKLMFDIDFFDNLLNIENNDELRNTIQQLAESTKGVVNGIYENIEGQNHVINLFNNIYSTFLETNDLDEMKKLLSSAEEAYIELLYDVDDFDSKNKEIATNLLTALADDYKEMQTMDNIEDIKEKIKLIKQAEYERVQRLNSLYEVERVEKQEIANVEEAPLEQQKSIKEVREVKKFFDEKIIGQEEAKRDVISAIYMNKLLNDPRNKNNCLLVGPTGSGKTLIAETVGEFYDMPIEIIDTTQLTMPGYVGASIEDFLERLVAKAKGDIKKAEEGIVVFDEIDKKGSRDNSDVSGKGVLNTLLPFIGGTTYDITYNNRRMQFDTSKLTIFATGAFTELAKGVNGTIYSETKIGFGNALEDKSKEDIKYKKFETDDYVKCGNIPAELIGRFSVITQLSGHTIESLRRILIESNTSALLSEKKKLETIDIDLRWTDGYLDAVAEKALKLKTGARSLKSTVDVSIKEARWEVLNNLDIYKAIVLTEKSVEDNRNCVLIDNQGMAHNLKDILEAKDKTSLVLVKR